MKFSIKQETGSVAFIVAILLPVILLILVATVDLGNLQNLSVNNQDALDAAATSTAEWVYVARKDRIRLPAGPDSGPQNWKKFNPSPESVNTYAHNLYNNNLAKDESLTETGDSFTATLADNVVTVRACPRLTEQSISRAAGADQRQVCNVAKARLAIPDGPFAPTAMAFSVDVSLASNKIDESSGYKMQWNIDIPTLPLLYTPCNRSSPSTDYSGSGSQGAGGPAFTYYTGSAPSRIEIIDSSIHSLLSANDPNQFYVSISPYTSITAFGDQYSSLITPSTQQVPNSVYTGFRNNIAGGQASSFDLFYIPWYSAIDLLSNTSFKAPLNGAMNITADQEDRALGIIPSSDGTPFDSYQTVLPMQSFTQLPAIGNERRTIPTGMDFDQRCEASKYSPVGGFGVQPLSNNLELLKDTHINDYMYRGGGPYHYGLTGIFSAYLTLSPGYQQALATASNVEVAPLVYGVPNTTPPARPNVNALRNMRKVIVHFSSGDDDTCGAYYSNFERDRIGQDCVPRYMYGQTFFPITTNHTIDSNAARYKHVCDAIKNQGIEIYVINMSRTAKDYNVECASEPKNKYLFENVTSNLPNILNDIKAGGTASPTSSGTTGVVTLIK